MGGNGEQDLGQPDAYRPVQAVSVTGLFPGFARPHFAPSNDPQQDLAQTNTLYLQFVTDEKIIGFEPIDARIPGTIVTLDTKSYPSVAVGDPAIYVYAFGPADAVVGFRNVVAEAIARRFDEIAPRVFAACTAAYFAEMTSRLPEVNRRAFDLLCEINARSARQWRDLSIFLTAIRSELRAMNIEPSSAAIQSVDRRGQLEVILALRPDHVQKLPRTQIENRIRKVLIGSGLFRPNDQFTLQQVASDEEPEQLRFADPIELDAALQQAKQFLEQRVFLPALSGAGLANRTLHVVRNTRFWISQFSKIGDLVLYMDRFKPNAQQRLPFVEIKRIGFEEVYTEFVKRFGRFRGFQTTVVDFNEGAAYSPFSLSIYTQSYSNRGPGIRPVGKIGAHAAVVVTVTLSGQRYANEWLDVGKRLKCYLKTRRGRGSQLAENDGANKAILNYPDVPILVFTRKPGEPEFVYNGVFRNVGTVVADENGNKWFDLRKV